MIFISLAREFKNWFKYYVTRINGKLENNLIRFNFKRLFSYVSRSIRFESSFRVEYPKNIQISLNSYYGLYCKIFASKICLSELISNILFISNVMKYTKDISKIITGNSVLIGQNVVFPSNYYKYLENYDSITKKSMTNGEIIIKDNVWISSNLFI